MKKLFLYLTFIIFLGGLVLAADAPPRFENEQFYGQVTWDKNLTVSPQKVIAMVGATEASSRITDGTCGEIYCLGNYGKGVTNTLKLQAPAGSTVTFFVDNVTVTTTPYSAYAITELNMNISRNAPLATVVNGTGNTTNNATAARPLNCTADWVCATWSTCTGGVRLRSCLDSNRCDTDLLSKNETEVCGQNGSSTSVSCQYDWQCSGWSVCQFGEQSRSCQRRDDCDGKFARKEVTSISTVPKPEESRSCQEQELPTMAASCTDGIKNQNEEKVDCGGVCKACVTKAIPWYYYGIPVLVVVLALLGWLVYYLVQRRGSTVSLSEEKEEQLKSYFQRNIERGLSLEQIKNNLVQGGWEEKLVKKFLKKNKF